MRSRSLAVGMAAVLAACGGERGGDAAGEPREGAAAVQPAPAAGGSISEAEVRDYRLTLPKVRQWHEATLIAARLRAQSPEPERDDEDGSTPDGMLDVIRSSPSASAAVRQAGLSAREAAILTYALVNASAAVAIEEAGQQPPAGRASPQQVAFVREHEAELERMQAEREALERQLSPDGREEELSEEG